MIVPGEAKLIRSAAERVLDGCSLRSIVLDWNARGLTTSTGRQWSQQSLRGLLLQRRLVGDRVYRGEVVVTDAFPEAVILDRNVFEGVQAVLRDPSRRAAKPVRSYLLTGVIRCSSCGARMRSTQAKSGPRRYACPPKPEGCNGRTIMAEPIEGLVSTAVLEALDGPALAEAMAASSTSANDEGDPAAEIRAAERRHEELSRQFARGELTRTEWAWMREELQSQVDDARARMAQATRRSPLARYTGAGIREQWPALSLEEQRQIIKAVVDRVEVAPATHGPVFDPSRLGIVWRA